MCVCVRGVADLSVIPHVTQLRYDLSHVRTHTHPTEHDTTISQHEAINNNDEKSVCSACQSRGRGVFVSCERILSLVRNIG